MAGEQGTVPAALASAPVGNGKLRVFISYSRDDLDFADQLDATLRIGGFDTSIDRHAISGGEEWQRRLGNLIREADTVVFVLSRSSAGSEICAWEVEEAVRSGKRIIPAVPHPLDGANPPQLLRDLSYIFFYSESKSPGSGFGPGLTQLVEALNTDLEWLREHTRLLLRATEWEAGGRETNRLLSGRDIISAKTWAAQRPKGVPEPTSLHLEFIRASEQEEDARLSAQRKQLAEMAAAQSERAKALHEAEQALKKTIQLQRRQAWGVTVTIAVLATVGWWAYGIIKDQRDVAREAARVDIRGQIVAYAAAFGSFEMDNAPGVLTSPYTTPLAQKLRQRKNVVEAITDAHLQVLNVSKGEQRPLLSTSMNGQIYLHQQPATRQKRVLAVEVHDPGHPWFNKLRGPPHDVEAIVATLLESGFDQGDMSILHDPDHAEIEEAINKIEQSLKQRSSGEASGQLAGPKLLTRVGLRPVPDEAPPESQAPEDNKLLFFFFSGHGTQIKNAEYLIPKISLAEPDLYDPDKIARSSIDVKWLTQRLEHVAAASIIILDTHFPPLLR
jgi:hypothetical protein